MAKRTNPLRTLLNPSRILIAVLIGLGVASFLIARNFDKDAFYLIEWSSNSLFWIGMSLVLMAVRDLAYMYRIRILTDKELSWRRSFDVIFLWEFASSITPSVVGGAAVAIFIINKEKIALGRSTAIVLITSLMDELFFIIMVPLLYVLLRGENLFNITDNMSFMNYAAGAKIIFWISYILIVVYSVIITYGIFINPVGTKRMLVMLFRLPLLRKWRAKAYNTGNELIIASKEMKGKPFLFWVKAFGATFFSWTARYSVINCLILAFVMTNEHILIYGRQLVMWMIMLISPTPGGSGIAEYAFSQYLNEFIPDGLNSSLALLWRLISYYPYLIIGVIVLPQWIQRVYLKRKLIKFKEK